MKRVGLNNGQSEQNCFLNVCVQALMSISCFRHQVSFLTSRESKVSDPVARELLVSSLNQEVQALCKAYLNCDD